MTTLEQISQYLERYGWGYDTNTDQHLLVTGFDGKTNTFRIFIHAEAPWVLLAIVPFVPRPLDACRDRFFEAVLRLNYELNLAKVGLDTEGDVALLVELAAENLTYEEFSGALDAISYYADEYYLPLTNLAVDPAYQGTSDWQTITRNSD